MKTSTFAAGVATALLGFAGLVTSAQAVVIGATPNANLLDSPFTFTFGDSNQASYTFSSDGVGTPAISVSTGGTALVLAVTFFDTNPLSLFAGEFIDENRRIGQPLAFPDGARVPLSNGSFVPLQFTLDDGIHFGYAEIAAVTDGDMVESATLFSFAFESEPGLGILTGAPIDRPINAVPEPSALALLSLGLIGLFVAARRRHNQG